MSGCNWESQDDEEIGPDVRWLVCIYMVDTYINTITVWINNIVTICRSVKEKRKQRNILHKDATSAH